MKTIWDNALNERFAQTLLSIAGEGDMRAFLRDVMTEKEITEISARLEAARLLDAGVKYTEVSRQTGLSSRTVARISEWMKNGSGGYARVLTDTNQHHAHLSPGRAD